MSFGLVGVCTGDCDWKILVCDLLSESDSFLNSFTDNPFSATFSSAVSKFSFISSTLSIDCGFTKDPFLRLLLFGFLSLFFDFFWFVEKKINKKMNS